MAGEKRAGITKKPATVRKKKSPKKAEEKTATIRKKKSPKKAEEKTATIRQNKSPKKAEGKPATIIINESPQRAADKLAEIRKNKLPKKADEKPKRKYVCRKKMKLELKARRSHRFVPEKNFNAALEMAQTRYHEAFIDTNCSCKPSIYKFNSIPNIGQHLRLRYARKCLIRREWLNLAKVLRLASDEKKHASHYPLLAKYGTLCMAHTDSFCYNKLIKFLCKMADGNRVLKQLTAFYNSDMEDSEDD